MSDVLMKEKAYCKIVLHAAKYPHCTINGVLLAEKSKHKDGRNLCLVDCIPLFHLGVGLSPMAEVALMQIDSYCKEKNLTLVGYYQANMNYYDNNPDCFALRLADKIHENNNDAVLIMVDNKQMTNVSRRIDSDEVALCLYHNSDGKWKQKDSASVVLDSTERTLKVISQLLESKCHRTLVDFDNYLDNTALSWENISLNEEIAKLF